jgi:membrane-anchored protein YejM (alkaline phosphatase superfamily)
MSAAGYRTALLTGADMRWHYLDNVTQARTCDEFLHFYAVDQATREKHILRDRIDGSLNDAFVIDQAADRLKQAVAAKTPTFSILYLLNLHQPYYSDPEDREFTDANLPKVLADKRILEMELSERHRVSLNNQYDNSIVNFDKNLSKLLDTFRDEQVLGSSVIMITGDHGEAFGEHGTYYHGTTVYDEQIKVPLLVRVGAKLPNLRAALEMNRQAVATGVDLSPTILAIAGGEIPAAAQGTPLTATQRKNYDFVFWTAGYQMAAVVTQTQKFIYDMETRVAQGFDLSRDPEEIVNTLDGKFEDFTSFLEHLEQTQVIQRVPNSDDQNHQPRNRSINQVKHTN